MDKKLYEKKLQKIKEKNKEKKQIAKLKAEGNKYKTKIETHKLIAIYLFIVFNIIMIYAMVAMWKFEDLSYLGVLISDIAAQILLYGIYCAKAYYGKKQEESMRFERERLNLGTEEETGEYENDSSELLG